MHVWGKVKHSEDELLAGCLRGEQQMQEAFYRHYAPRMFAICLRYAGSYPEAEDMLQEGFIKVFNNLATFRGEGSFEGWIKRVFVNAAIEGYRKNHAINMMLDIDDVQQDLVQHDDFHHLSAHDLLKMVKSLSPGYRTIFNLYAIEGYSHQEIADMLHINIGTSKSQLARARYLLQKMVLQSQKVQRYAAVL